MTGLSGRAAIVTGATGNLGRVVVRRMLEGGAHVALPMRDEAKAEGLRNDYGGDDRVKVAVAHLTDETAMAALVEDVLRAWGRLDALANLAGGFATGPATDLAGIRALWEQNVTTAIVTTAACLRPMRARRYGRVVSVAAMSALKAGRGGAGYAMAKGALVRWSEALAAEVKADGVTVNAVLPATIDQPVNRASMPKADPSTWASPDEVASVILFLLSEEASGVTGAAIPITART